MLRSLVVPVKKSQRRSKGGRSGPEVDSSLLPALTSKAFIIALRVRESAPLTENLPAFLNSSA